MGTRKKGCLEIVASCATHAFLPNCTVHPESVQAQINVGIDHYIKTFGRKPKGFWLPSVAIIRGLMLCCSKGVFVTFSGFAWHFFGTTTAGLWCICTNTLRIRRCSIWPDPQSSKQVWSADEGYPGDPYYREYYRDIGHELPMDYIKPYIDPCGTRISTGINTGGITGRTENKEFYQPSKALAQTKKHAAQFIQENVGK